MKERETQKKEDRERCLLITYYLLLIGSAYRHELIEIPMETSRESATWPGQNGYQNVSFITAITNQNLPHYC